MMETVFELLTAFAFGLGMALSTLGYVLLYQILFSGRNFRSQFLVMQLAILLISVGTALLFFVLA